MKSKNPDKFLKVRRLVKKLGELAVVLDDISRKMHYAVEKQKVKMGRIEPPSREGRKYLDSLHKKLETITDVPIANITIAEAQEISESLLDPRSRRTSSSRMTYHEYVEFSCVDEYRKFRAMPALTFEEIQLCNWDELYERLAAVE
jgi:hypothetical protein